MLLMDGTTLENPDGILILSGIIVLVVIVLALVFIFMTVYSSIQKKRALAFTKRFAILSESLSSFKAVSYRIANQLKHTRSQMSADNMTRADAKKVLNYLEGIMYIFDNLSVGTIPPTEEIAMSALSGKKTSLEDRAYEDSIKFRDDMRQLRQLIDKHGLDGLASWKQDNQTNLQ